MVLCAVRSRLFSIQTFQRLRQSTWWHFDTKFETVAAYRRGECLVGPTHASLWRQIIAGSVSLQKTLETNTASAKSDTICSKFSPLWVVKLTITQWSPASIMKDSMVKPRDLHAFKWRCDCWKTQPRAWKASARVDLRSKWRIGISVAQYLIYSYLKAERDGEGKSARC